MSVDGALDIVIQCMVGTGLGERILWQPQTEPADLWNIVRSGGQAQIR
jgi:hypothetical protein